MTSSGSAASAWRTTRFRGGWSSWNACPLTRPARGSRPFCVRSSSVADDASMSQVGLYEVRGSAAVVTMNRPDYRNAQNSAMTYALDRAFQRAVDDDGVKVIVLAGAGKHFSAGHDIGTPGRDVDVHYDNTATIWWDHV